MRGGKISDGGTDHTDVLNLESSTRTEIQFMYTFIPFLIYLSIERGRSFAVQDEWLHLHGLGAERPGLRDESTRP